MCWCSLKHFTVLLFSSTGASFFVWSRTPLTVRSCRVSVSQVSIHQRWALKLFWQVKNWDFSRKRMERSRNVRNEKEYSATLSNLLSADGTVFFKYFLCITAIVKEWNPAYWKKSSWQIHTYLYIHPPDMHSHVCTSRQICKAYLLSSSSPTHSLILIAPQDAVGHIVNYCVSLLHLRHHTSLENSLQTDGELLKMNLQVCEKKWIQTLWYCRLRWSINFW